MSASRQKIMDAISEARQALQRAPPAVAPIVEAAPETAKKPGPIGAMRWMRERCAVRESAPGVRAVRGSIRRVREERTRRNAGATAPRFPSKEIAERIRAARACTEGQAGLDRRQDRRIRRHNMPPHRHANRSTQPITYLRVRVFEAVPGEKTELLPDLRRPSKVISMCGTCLLIAASSKILDGSKSNRARTSACAEGDTFANNISWS